MVTDPFEYARRGARSTAPDDPLVADFQRERQERTAYQIKLSPPAEHVATANAVARRAGVPAPLVQANLEGYQAKEQLEKTMEIFSRFGNISRWADKDPRNAQSVKDDDESLGLLGEAWETLKDLKVAPRAFAGALEAGTLGAAQMADDSFKALDDFNRFVTHPIRVGLSAAEKTIFGSGFFDPEASAKLANDIFDENRDQRDIIAERARYKTENFWAKNLLAGTEAIPLSTTAVLIRNPEAGTALLGTLVGAVDHGRPIAATKIGGRP